MSKRCVEWGEETRKECAEYRDQGYNSCARWDSDCCDWWPCSWGCKILSWFCVAWYWVSNVVCVAWTYITTVVCLVWEVVVTVVSIIIEAISVIVGVIISFIDFVLEVIFSIPILGRLLKQLWTILTELFYRFFGLIDALAWVIGIRPEKKLRMCVIILRDEKGPVADSAMVIEEVQAAIEIFREEANVRLIPVSIFNSTTPFSDDRPADDSFIHIVDSVSKDDVLDVHCGGSGYLEDLWMAGSEFNILMSRHCFLGNARRLLRYGGPVTVFVVRSMAGATGCSMAILTDYVTVVGTETTDKTTIAHESGHACGLWHVSPTDNLMFDTDSNARRKMTNFQAVNFRNSSHVTYF